MLPLLLLFAETFLEGKPWPRHTIDKSLPGADGVRLIDINTDGRPDIATAWEEGGMVRVYFNPSRVDSRSEWRFVTVGKVTSPEDAVFADLDGDLAFDVISSAEGEERTLYIHWAPKDPDQYFEESAWKTEAIPASAKRMQWMFAAPVQLDGNNGVDIVAAGKNEGAELGWMEAPKNPREMALWKWHPLRKAGWIMSIQIVDMDGDGDPDILFSDRKGANTGVYWLENPGAPQTGQWKEHAIGSAGKEVMFIDYADFDGDGRMDVIAAVKPREVHVHRRLGKDGLQWSSEAIPFPAQVGAAKSVRAADINQDGKIDLVYSAEQAKGELRGVAWMSLAGRVLHDISGAEGTKYDLIELIDLDGDGDLDVLTTEEVDGLGVVWYENPGR